MDQSEQLNQLQEKCLACCEYIKAIYSEICFHPDDLVVEHNIGDFLYFTIKGNKRDDGVLIGRSGATVQALRLFVNAYSKTHLGGSPCVVVVEDHMGSKFNPFANNPNAPFSRRPRK